MKRFFLSSIGKKIFMALSGFALVSFAAIHLLGNLLTFKGAKAINLYAHTLTSTPLIYIAEISLLLIFMLHITLGLVLFWENKRARPHNYQKRRLTGRGATFASSTMPYSGLLLLIFLVLHLLHFKFGTNYQMIHNSEIMRDFYHLMLVTFRGPLLATYYIAMMIILFVHLSHGIQSLFQSLGISHPQYTPILKKFGLVISIMLGIGFISIPIFLLFKEALV